MATATKPGGSNTDPSHDDAQRRVNDERLELLRNVQAMLEPFMVALGIVFTVLLIVDYGGFASETRYAGWLATAFNVIWVVFIVDFLLRYTIAPEPDPALGFVKLRFLKANWLTVVSLALPALRPLRAIRGLRALRAARATRSLSLVRLIGGVNRGIRLLRRLAGQHAFGYVAGMSVFVVLLGATGAWYFDQGIEDAPIQSFGDALWWASTLITTMNSEKYVVSPEARVIGLLMRVFALSVFGYVTATIASYLVGQRVVKQQSGENRSAEATMTDRLEVLQQEIRQLREELIRSRERSG